MNISNIDLAVIDLLNPEARSIVEKLMNKIASKGDEQITLLKEALELRGSLIETEKELAEMARRHTVVLDHICILQMQILSGHSLEDKYEMMVRTIQSVGGKINETISTDET